MAEPKKEFVGWAPKDTEFRAKARVNSGRLTLKDGPFPDWYVDSRVAAYERAFTLLHYSPDAKLSFSGYFGTIVFERDQLARLVATQEVSLKAMGLVSRVEDFKTRTLAEQRRG